MRYVILNQNNIVQNIVIVDNFEDTEQAICLFFKDNVIIKEDVSTTGYAYVDGDFADGYFRMPKPHHSWIWDSNKKEWVAPVPYPSNGHTNIWNEKTLSWEKITVFDS